MVVSTHSESARLTNKAAWISMIASVVIFLLKLYAHKVTGSAAVLSDALESIVNVVASFVALLVIRFASQPADTQHPYGHGKAESFSAAFEGGMILFASIVIIGQSLRALWLGELTQDLEIGILIVGGASVLNLLLGLYLRRMGRIHRSEALHASSAHVLSDVVTTIGIIIGLGLVLLTGYKWLDPLIAIVVGLQLAYTGFGIVRKSLAVLMDEQDLGALEKLAKSLQAQRFKGIIDIHALRIMRAGKFHHIDAHLVVPEYWDISRVHSVCHDFEEAVVSDYHFDGEFAFHVDPCKKSFCSVCAVDDCSIRVASFEAERPFTVKYLTDGPQKTN